MSDQLADLRQLAAEQAVEQGSELVAAYRLLRDGGNRHSHTVPTLAEAYQLDRPSVERALAREGVRADPVNPSPEKVSKRTYLAVRRAKRSRLRTAPSRGDRGRSGVVKRGTRKGKYELEQ